MKKNIFVLLAAAFGLCLVSCDPIDYAYKPRTADEIVAYMNANYDGTFTKNSYSSENVSSDFETRVSMTCTLPNGTVLNNVITYDKYLMILLSTEEFFMTNYYSYVYGDQTDAYYMSRVDGILSSDFTTDPGYKLVNLHETKGNYYERADRFVHSFSDYIELSHKDVASYGVVMFCDKTSDYKTEKPYLKLNAFKYDVNNGSTYDWVNSIDVYYDSSKTSDTVTSSLFSDLEWKSDHFVISVQ